MGIRSGTPPRAGGRTGYLNLNRPQALTAVNGQFDRDINDALPEFDIDEEVWVCIIHGNGH